MAEPYPDYTGHIATASVGEGLDFACNLLSDEIQSFADTHPSRASDFLRDLTQYISFRYAGEDELALDQLVMLGRETCSGQSSRQKQFWNQMKWIARELELPVSDAPDGGLTNRCT